MNRTQTVRSICAIPIPWRAARAGFSLCVQENDSRMTGFKSRHFRYSCKEKRCYYEQLPEWDDLIEMFAVLLC
jgi:hypothetical protein